MKSIRMKYGNSPFDLKAANHVDVLTFTTPTLREPLSAFREKLLQKIPNKFNNSSNISVVVADKTRFCGYSLYLPILFQVLKDRGVNKNNITIFISYGTHPHQTDEESLDIYGSIYKQYKWVHHNCDEKKNFIEKGITSKGTPIRYRRDILDSDFIITFGAISHHYFAGFGGGRKLIFPGLGERDAILHNHSLFLDRKNYALNRFCKTGVLNENPIAQDLFDVELTRQADLSIHGLLNENGDVCEFIIGNGKDDYLLACDAYDKLYKIKCDKTYELVIASCGGFPKDINFIQAHKSIDNAARFVQDGGMLIIFAECKDGIGSSTFLSWFEMGGFRNVFNKLTKNYIGNGGTALSLMSKTDRIKISLVTLLEKSLCEKIGVGKMSFSRVNEISVNGEKQGAVILNASLLIKEIS